MSDATCRVCGGELFRRVRESQIQHPLSPGDFAITDSHYGRTPAIDRCSTCGFLQCHELGNILSYYQELEDTEYEATRPQRVLQARKLLRTILKGGRQAQGRLLDIGASSGALVEAAVDLGWQAEGVEPSAWLAAKARKKALRVIEGVLPDSRLTGSFDVITIIDVLEHVESPLDLLLEAQKLLAAGGIICIVTPDVGSVAAGLFRWRWWHYRIAHISYFTPSALANLCERAGLKVTRQTRTGWLFTLEYIFERAQVYLPPLRGMKLPSSIAKKAISLNLLDSVLIVAERQP